jgi:hypothetical protein
MKVLFWRKVLSLEELKRLKKKVNDNEIKSIAYEISREVVLSDKEYKEFTENFNKDQPWITEEDGGINEKGEFVCIRVKNTRNKNGILVNTEGYTYPRYIAIES